MTNIDKKGYQPITIRCYSKDRQLLFENLVLCAYDIRTQKIVAFGKDSLSFQNDNYIYVCNPMKWGAVADYSIFQKVLHNYMKEFSTSFFRKAVIGLCVPANLTEVQKKAFEDAVISSKVTSTEMFLFEMPFSKICNDIDVSNDKLGIGKKVTYYIELVSDYYSLEYYE